MHVNLFYRMSCSTLTAVPPLMHALVGAAMQLQQLALLGERLKLGLHHVFPNHSQVRSSAVNNRHSRCCQIQSDTYSLEDGAVHVLQRG
jgi:hypothetical protein